MPAKPKNPLRPLTEQEKSVLLKISRSMSASADQVARAKALLAVAEGKTYQQAAAIAGRKSNDAVSQLVSRFNQEGLTALETKHGGGPAIEYSQTEKERIIREFQRTPDRTEDGTATWSLVTLQRSLRKAGDGLPHVSTYVIWQTLHEAGLSWQLDRSWCDTGKVIRLRKSGPVEVEDPDTLAKKKSHRTRLRTKPVTSFL
jgi:transposase